MSVEWIDGKPVTTPTFKNGCWVFRTSWEDQKRLIAWNYKVIGLLADELAKRRDK